jgi:hypothetical protein
MARRAVGVSLTSTVIGHEGFKGAGHVADPINTVSPTATTAALSQVSTDVAVLVADGATPTQAHVTTLNGHLTTLNSSYSALIAGSGPVPPSSDVVLSYDTAAVGSRSALERAIAVLLHNVMASNDFAH